MSTTNDPLAAHNDKPVDVLLARKAVAVLRSLLTPQTGGPNG